MQCLDKTAGQFAKLLISSAIKPQMNFIHFCFWVDLAVLAGDRIQTTLTSFWLF